MSVWVLDCSCQEGRTVQRLQEGADCKINLNSNSNNSSNNNRNSNSSSSLETHIYTVPLVYCSR